MGLLKTLERLCGRDAPLGHKPVDLDADYDMVKSWWDKHNLQFPEKHALPNTGVIITFNDIPVCSLFLYYTNSSVAWLEWFVCNPDVSSRTKYRGLELAGQVLTQQAKDEGYKQLYSHTAKPSIAKRLKKDGWDITNIPLAQLTRRL